MSPKELEEIKGRHQRVLTERVERYADPDHLFWDAENMSRAVMDLSRDLLEARADKAALLDHISYQDKALSQATSHFDLRIGPDNEVWTACAEDVQDICPTKAPDLHAWLRSKGEKG